jgi:ubiquinone/menaquinone biosynthesis C-methylase UbiE
MTDYLDRIPDYRDPAIVAALDEVSLWSARFGLLLLDHIPLAHDLTVLDVGCGTGFPLLELAQRLGPSCRIVGADPWAAGLARAAEKAQRYGLDNVELVATDGVRLPFAAAEFDLIVANLVLNNVEQPETFLTECARVAKVGARLALTTNVMGHMREFYDLYRAVLLEQGLPRYLGRLEDHEAHRGTKASISRLVEEAGFDITKATEDTFSLRYQDGTTFLNHFFIRLGFLHGWRAIVDEADARTVFAALEQALNQCAAREGELRFTVPMLYLEAARR